MTAISVSVGGALASLHGIFSWPLFLITLLLAVILHGAVNLINDYYDVLSGVDTLETSTAQYRPHPLLEGKLTPREVRNGAYLLFCIAIIFGSLLAAIRGWTILAIGTIGVVAGFTYTSPPFKYKYKAMGEISVFLMWGPLMVEGSYWVQRQHLSMDAFWISLPFGVLVALVLLANNIRDIDHDQKKGIQTLPILMKERNSLWLYTTLIVAAYLSILLMSLLGLLPLWSLLIFISLPLAARLLHKMAVNIPLDADAQTAQLDTAFGVLLVISLVLERIL